MKYWLLTAVDRFGVTQMMLRFRSEPDAEVAAKSLLRQNLMCYIDGPHFA